MTNRASCQVLIGCGIVFAFLLPTVSIGDPLTIAEYPLQGVIVEQNQSGGWEKIYATGRQSVDILDRRGISSAQKIAELRAKSEIIKFFNQELTVEAIATEFEGTQQATIRKSGISAGYTKEATRTLASSVAETMKSYSRGSLRGVVILEAGYNDKTEEAWVKVGVSRDSVALAVTSERGVSGPGAQHPIGGPSPDKKHGQSVIRKQPSEVRGGRPLP
jgi:hypothetical protein